MKAIIIFIALIISSQVFAHSWYDLECCDLRDCEPMPKGSVILTPQGYYLPNGVTVPYDQARPSMDEDYHWCRWNKDSPVVIHPPGKNICFYAPLGGA